PLQGLNSRRHASGERHPRADLEIRRLRVEELFRQASLGTGGNAQSACDLVAQNHGRILKEMLGDEILALGKTSGALQGPEGYERLKKALAKASVSIPTPKIRGRSIGRTA